MKRHIFISVVFSLLLSCSSKPSATPKRISGAWKFTRYSLDGKSMSVGFLGMTYTFDEGSKVAFFNPSRPPEIIGTYQISKKEKSNPQILSLSFPEGEKHLGGPHVIQHFSNDSMNLENEIHETLTLTRIKN